MLVEVIEQHAVMSDLVLDEAGVPDQDLRKIIFGRVKPQELTQTREYFKSFAETFGGETGQRPAPMANYSA
jgi:hypothetical protein